SVAAGASGWALAALYRPSSCSMTNPPAFAACRIAASLPFRVLRISVIPRLAASASLRTSTFGAAGAFVGAFAAGLPPLAPSFACAGFLPLEAVVGAFAGFAAVAALSPAFAGAFFVVAFFVVVAMVMAPLGKGLE